ncbi:unnamed protein product (macronuclear) [Paramecium tetraurelia]|uniref:Transmembrane protein n=1 Tax=Paramecium tetraurelia TaxID=5888 RepID=A0DE53_PARTE|nr:uncharacterized protein GSPATT00016162001 [Paramecium tetraurelia]CAK81320.1 unnamed protein product [Paramecium tetraurelia]|eukprot:XP_001448717.1 hypothetical protein (macronuclear) [Paramecium tetraurelia strain d4-2]
MRSSFTSAHSKGLISKKVSAPTSEITAEFLKRQKEYESINKYSQQEESNDNMKASLHKSNYHVLKDAVNDAKQKFFESTPQRKNFMNSTIPSYQQQYNSIQYIANQFRTQKKSNCFTQNEKKQQQKQWNLRLILLIVIPLICLIRVFFALFVFE